MKRVIPLACLLVILLVVMTAQSALAAEPVDQQVAVTQTTSDTKPITTTVTIPFLEEWLSSPHADFAAEAFIHWNEEDPAEVPESCAKCHSTPGHLDFLGVDGSAAGAVDAPAPIGSVVECVACHNSVNQSKTSAVMPSGLELTNLGDEARCVECHQGRQS
jgi:hypothetical protein